MATITHNRVAGSASNPDVLVDGPAWDEGHVLSGQIGLSNGGTNADLSATGGTGQVLKQASAGAAVTVGTVAASEVSSPAALTKTDDTNVTLTLGGTPTTALLQATSVTVGWTGTLAAARLNSNVVQAITDDTNVTGSITAQNLTLGWTGTLAVSRGGTGISSLGTGVATALGVNVGSAGAFVTFNGALGAPSSGTLTNATGLPLTTGITGTLAVANGGTGLTSLTAHYLLIGNGTSAGTLLAPGTAGLPLVSNGASLDPSYSTLPVSGGGSGANSATAYAVLCGGTTSTSAFQSIAGLGSAGEVLTSNGAGALPTFQAAGAGDLISTNNLSDVANATTARLNLQAPCFSAHKNGTNQTGVPANSASTVKITFTTEAFDYGSYYDTTNSRWTPPASRVRLTVSAYLSVNAVDQAQSLLAIFKNGSLYKYVAISNASGTLGTVLNGSCIDDANGTDYYEAFFNKGGAGDGTLSGTAAYTWFQGEVL